VGAASTLGFPNIVRAASGQARRVIVLAIDGMDPGLLLQYVREGRMPACKRLIENGTFAPLGTSTPPQSPVAWSDFVSGADPGQHGIFDFIARDPETMKPYLASARTSEASLQLPFGDYLLPLAGAKLELLRDGHTLWDLLDRGGIDTTVLYAPVNFPPGKSGARTFSGLTTPDIHGSYGVFTLFSEDPDRRPGTVSGGRIDRISFSNGVAKCLLRGPANTLRKDQRGSNVVFTVEVNRARTMARLDVQGRRALLRRGEWSDWIPVSFEMIPHLASASGICRFFLKEISPRLELYMSPVNIDPFDPVMPLSSPEGYSRELVQDVGYFYTQGMAEDTSALSAGVLDDSEYRQQAINVLEEQERLFHHELSRFDEGFLFGYFSSLDLNSHAFWRCMDDQHPMYDEAVAREHGDFLPWLYSRLDKVVGETMLGADDQTAVFVMSDHGFVTFRRTFNLNTWLLENGYATLLNRSDREASYFQNTDWGQTRAYAIGINSLYLNLRDREADGTVSAGDAKELKQELATRLKAARDPATGEPVATNVYDADHVYHGDHVKDAPDLIVGYTPGYRASWETILGAYPPEVLGDNMDPWSGDHCMDPRYLPGVLLSNRVYDTERPLLRDLAPTILGHFGLPVPPEMTGKALRA
jgi:predicted AlkP superfamily phosphohydrolase/phosphomutase